MDAAPRHFHLFGSGSRAVIARETTAGAGTRTWLRNYFLVRVVFPDEGDFVTLDALSDVVRLDDAFSADKLSKLSLAGINVSGLSAGSARESIECRIVQWLTQESKSFFAIGLNSGQ
jgi:hypothetical protein